MSGDDADLARAAAALHGAEQNGPVSRRLPSCSPACDADTMRSSSSTSAADATTTAGSSATRSACDGHILRNMPEYEDGEKGLGASAQADQWDARYSEPDGAMWSGRPNGRLLVDVASLTPDRALDVGCGEGADAIWLARSGWTVTAIDISEVAIGRAREAAELVGAAVEWVCGDALQIAFPTGSFALVSMQYPALPKASGAAVRVLLDAVQPGGLLLAVYHDLDDEHREHMKSRGVDPKDYVDADDLAQMLAEEFTVELHAVEARIDPPPDNPHVADVVLRARRR